MLENKQKLLNVIYFVLILIVIVNLIVLNIVLFSGTQDTLKPQIASVQKVKDVIKPPQPSPEIVSEIFDQENVGLICRSEIANALASISAKLDSLKEVEPEVKYVAQQIAEQGPPVKYVSLGGGVSTTNREWSYIGGAEAYFDKSAYADAKYIFFEAFLKINSGNGHANARLYDATHKMVIADSEILGGGTSFKLVTTGPLMLMDGNNFYEVQLRTTTGYEAYMENARFKVEY